MAGHHHCLVYHAGRLRLPGQPARPVATAGVAWTVATLVLASTRPDRWVCFAYFWLGMVASFHHLQEAIHWRPRCTGELVVDLPTPAKPKAKTSRTSKRQKQQKPKVVA
ncbi:MAG: hypothetical protein NZ821_06675 [Gloeomargarita sp. SKYB31]|nr:hypothetical protein [Gloeomargarita sp. SKYB31]